MKRSVRSRILVLLVAIAACVSLLPVASVSAAGDAMSLSQTKTLLNSVTLYPQRTGYAEVDKLLEQILQPYKNADTYTKFKAIYDWIIRNVTYSWEGYSQNWAPAYDKFTLTYNLTYEEGLQEAIPREMIYRAYHSLTAKKGVCYDMAALLAIGARYIGIEAVVHTGYFTLEAGYGNGAAHHGWTELIIDGAHYIFDPQREYRMSGNGAGTIPYKYFGITMANSWRYAQETQANAVRDAGFLPVTAERAHQVEILVIPSASGTVSGGGLYVTGEIAKLIASTKVPIAGWYAEDGALLGGASTYSFRVTGDTSIYAIFEGDYFYDIPLNAWYRSDAIQAASQGIVYGVSPIRFDSEGVFTRAMVAAILARSSGEDVREYPAAPFVDVPENAWYAGAVNWAYANGISYGIGNSQYAPDRPVTREELLTILVRFLKNKGVAAQGEELTYTDASQISLFAYEAIRQAQALGLVSGYSDGTLKPKANLTRAEGVAFMMRALRCLEAANG